MEPILIKTSDLYDVMLSSIITEYDLKIITRLYQPIVGYGPVSLYFTLFSEVESEKTTSNSTKTHERLFAQMDITSERFLKFRQLLEGIGLLKTYVLKDENVNRYVYSLLSPYLPNNFFNHPVLNTLLSKRLSLEEYEKTKSYFVSKNKIKTSYVDISKNIQEVFFNDLKTIHKPFNNNDKNIKERVEGEIVVPFDVEVFLTSLKDYQLPKRVLTSALLKQIAEIALVYEIKAYEMHKVVVKAYNYQEEKLEISQIEYFAKAYYAQNHKFKENAKPKNVKVNYIPTNSNLAKKVELLNEVTPEEYFKLRNNNVLPLTSDFDVINKLKSTSMPNPVINVVIDFTIERCDNLNRNYALKVANTLLRANVNDAYEAMVYLNKDKKKEIKNIVTNEKTPSLEENREVSYDKDQIWWDDDE